MSAKADKIARDRRNALIARLSLPNPPTDAASLAQSYGVPIAEVEKLLKGVRHA